jgi:rhomboid family protein
MAGILDEIKKVFQRTDNALNQLIMINIIVFAVLVVLRVFSTLFGVTGIFDLVYSQFSIPPDFSAFLGKPWTIITYSFAHSLRDIFHILFNLLFIYWFGRLISEYLGSQKVVNLYILGALAGGILYLIFYNLIPFFKERIDTVSGMVGASAAVYAIMVAAATLLPNYSVHLIFIGPVKIKYIAVFYIFISFMGSIGANAGGNIAHLGGALIGFLYIKQIQNGVDMGKPIQTFLEFFRGLSNPSRKIKVSYKASKKPQEKNTSTSTSAPTQKEIDEILDKIADKGYESLSKTEKEKLFNFGKEKN